MAEAEQEIDVGGPRADALDRGQPAVGFRAGKGDEVVEVEAVERGGGDGAERPDLRRGKSRRAEIGVARSGEILGAAVGKGGGEAVPDRRGARHRELLADDDAGEPDEAGRAATERHLAGDADDLAEPPVALAEVGQPLGDVGLALDDPQRTVFAGHADRC